MPAVTPPERTARFASSRCRPNVRPRRSGADGARDHGADVRGYRYDALDGVRGLAAQVVLVCHGLGMTALSPAHSPAAAANEWLGRASVMVFFSLSGFVIATSLSRLIAQDRRGFLLPYAVHRLARIWPPLILAITVTFAVGALGHAGLPLLTMTGDPYRLDWIAFLRGITLTFGPGDATFVIDRALWSLRQEVYLYVIAALAAVSLVGRGFWRIAAGAAACAMIAATADRFFYLQSLVLFSAGAGAALFGGMPRLRALARAPWVAPVTILLWLAPLGFVGVPGYVDAMSNDPAFLAYQALIGLPLSLALLGLALDEGAVSRSLAALRGLASFSYTLYVIHVPVMTLIFSLRAHAGLVPGMSGDVATLVAALALAQGVAYAAALFVERPRFFRALLFSALGRIGLARPVQPAAG